jgi:peptidoglycan/LPS O-acetylase OafA/YrhL
LANYGTQWLTWFFMLSGFVLALRYGETDWSKAELHKYLVARLTRILPGYLIAVVISFAVVSVGISVRGMCFFVQVSGRVSL